MITLETTVTHTEKKMLSISAPSFWKDPCTSYDTYRAVLDEKTFIQIDRLWDGESIYIRNTTIERSADKILEAQEKWTIVTEQEFLQAFDDTWEAMRLHPEIV